MPVNFKRTLILASGSPRRAEILRKAGFDFQIAVSDVAEDIIAGPPAQTALVLAQLKAQAVAAKYPDAWIIGADTVVALNGEILGKPYDSRTALTMLTKLNGQTHEVVTGVCLCQQRSALEYSFAEISQVTFKNNPPARLAAYAASAEPLDKAGAYAIQGEGRQLIAEVKGDLDNVIGFPLQKFQKLCQEKL